MSHDSAARFEVDCRDPHHALGRHAPDTQIAANLRRAPARQVRYVITRGDTLSEIAERYNVSTAAIRRANKLSNDKIRVGQTLQIPVYAGG